jgi:hypothetical protein
MKRVRDNEQELIHKAIGEDGFVVLRGDFNCPSSAFVGELKEFLELRSAKKPDDCIFNGIGSDTSLVDPDYPVLGDQKRFQTFFSKARWKGGVPDFISQVKAYSSSLVPGRFAKDFVFLLSTSNCADQPPHTDYNAFNKYEDDGVCKGYPLGCIITIEDDTALNVWPKSIDFVPEKKYAHQRLSLAAGDVVIFRSDFVHSGASYEKSNIRIHFFLDSPNFVRDENRTYDMEFFENIEKIQVNKSK